MAVVTYDGGRGYPTERFDSYYFLVGSTFELTPNLYFLGSTGSFFARAIGRDFTYNDLRQISGGVIERIRIDNTQSVEIVGLEFSGARFGELVHSGQRVQLNTELFAGADTFTGSAESDVIVGYGGDDSLTGMGGADRLEGGDGNDQIFGGAGDDKISENSGSNYLRGEDGNDSIVGGAGFDDINGNAGNDTCVSGGGDDWVVGGKDNDSLTGSAGQNLVYGNLGADTCEGGDGNDVVRGGQDNDSLSGGSGDDYVSGDKGDDTVTGGGGADVFHTFGDAGLDRVLDFNRAEGDRVLLDPGTHYTVAQVGADTVISMTGGGQMVLVGVQLSGLTSGWIFGA